MIQILYVAISQKPTCFNLTRWQDRTEILENDYMFRYHAMFDFKLWLHGFTDMLKQDLNP